MMLLYALAAAALLWWLSKVFVRSDTAAIARAVKVLVGVTALGGAVYSAGKGGFILALALGAFGAWALGWTSFKIPVSWRVPRKKEGRFSRIRSAMIEMEIDHATGAVEGIVLEGAQAGRSLSSLDGGSLSRLYEECNALDPDAVPLLEVYFDRRFSGWREHAQGDRDTRTRTHSQSGVMTKDEAYQILGLQPGASLIEIRQAHRTLMKKFHPDQGGTAYLAARINQAREVLLGRHR